MIQANQDERSEISPKKEEVVMTNTLSVYALFEETKQR